MISQGPGNKVGPPGRDLFFTEFSKNMFYVGEILQKHKQASFGCL